MPIRPRNTNQVFSDELNASHVDHVHTGADGSDKVAHSDLSGIGTDDHHAEAHTVASHSDTTATGAELETLTDGSDADALHTHGAIQSQEEVEDIVGGMVSGNTETLIAVTYDDPNGKLNFVVDEASIDHGAIAGLADNDHTQYFTRSGVAAADSAWSTWTPGDNTGLTIGNGTSQGRYIQVGKAIYGWGEIVLGSTSSVSSGVSTTLPVTASSSENIIGGATVDAAPVGFVKYLDASPLTGYFGYVRLESTSRLRFLILKTDSTYLQDGGINGSVPITWASGDAFEFRFAYEAA